MTSVYELNEKQFKLLLGTKCTRNDIWRWAPEIYAYLSGLFEENCSDSLLREWAFQWATEPRVAGLDFVNEAGYSITTSKHINWAREALGYEYTGVKLWTDEASVIASSYASEDKKLEAIKVALYREQDDLLKQMSTKKRKDTQVYEGLSNELARVHKSILTVEGR